MMDDLEKLKAAMRRAEPAPDPARKAEALSRAMAEFERVQGSAERARRREDRPEKRAGFLRGASAMFSRLTSRAALAGTASVAVIALGIVLIGPDLMTPPEPERPLPVETPPLAATEAPVITDVEIDDARNRVGAEEGAATTAAPEALAATAPEAPVVGGEPADAPGQVVLERSESGEAAPRDSQVAMSNLAEEERAESDGLALGYAAGADSEPAIAGMPAPVIEPYIAPPEPNTEAYPEAETNPLKITAEEPVSTFSIDVDTASYAVVRSSLEMAQLPPEEAVRIEEMVNYFPYAWPAPGENEGPFRPSVSVMETPWNAGTKLVTIALQGRRPALEDRPPLNLVFLVDTSGSMDEPAKLPLLIQSLRLMLPELVEGDEVAIVAYAGSAGMVLEPTPAEDRDAILEAFGRLHAGGSTAGQEGLELAYTLGRKMAAEGEVTRVLLATDGDFNVGISDPEALEDYIARERESGIYLSILGFGRGNLDDAIMQSLAQNGNGTASYIDNLNEAQKVLVDQLSGALFPIADDVKIQVEWNPATVAEYRLIGYETRALAREDFNNDRVDAGEIGAGHSVTAIYEITPVGSDAQLTDPLRYGEAAPSGPANELGFLRLRYKEPGEEASELIETPILLETQEAGAEARFAAAIAGFGQLLKDGAYLGEWSWDEAIALATEAKGADPYGYRAEAIGLMRLAESLSQ
jgi:Ca-activated chloride channel family protein